MAMIREEEEDNNNYNDKEGDLYRLLAPRIPVIPIDR